MIPFCGTFPKDSKSTALGLLGIYIYSVCVCLISLRHDIPWDPIPWFWYTFQGGEPRGGRRHHHGHFFSHRHGRIEALPRRRLAESGGICTTLQVGDGLGFLRPGV